MKSASLAVLAFALATPLLRADAAAPASPTYPLSTCVVSGESLTESDMGGPVTYTHQEEGKPDREIRFCCKMCIGKFKKDPAKYLAKLDAAAAASSTAPMGDAPSSSPVPAPSH